MEQAFLDAAGAALTGALGGDWRMLPTLQASNGETHSIVAGAGQVLSREWIARVV